MCGVCGIFRPEGRVDEGVLRAMTATLAHRGPDDRSVHVDGAVGLGHTRLSIIDLSHAGAQPLTNEDGSVLCVFNGEIYNFRELRKSLENRGHQFRGRSDGEVLPHLYEEYGDALFDHLRGMFAIAIVDLRRRRLLLGRDRFGIKPLYFADLGDQVVFGSEIKAVVAHPLVPRKVDLQAIHDYLGLLYVPTPSTAFLDVREVEPGAAIVWGGGRWRQGHHFWSASEDMPPVVRDASTEEVGRSLDAAVTSQLVADVPLGAFLSGGIDSSLVVQSASSAQRGGDAFPAFTVGFPDPAYDESDAARIVAAACEVDHTVLRLQEGGADPDLVQELLVHFDQPFADSSAIPTFLVSRAIRDHVKVALSGDGGDEMFGGYERFWRAPALWRLRNIPGPLRRSLALLAGWADVLSPDRSRQLRKALDISGHGISGLLAGLSSYLSEDDRRVLYATDGAQRRGLLPTSRLFECPAGADPSAPDGMDRALTASMLRLSLPGDMLRKVDMMSMKAGLEVRVPFLDEHLANLAMGLPHAAKVRGRTGKIRLRELARRRLPPSVASKGKWGFGIPLDRWASPAFRDMVHDLLLGPDARTSGLLETSVVRTWVDAFDGRRDIRASVGRLGVYQRVFMMLSLELWLREFAPSLP